MSHEDKKARPAAISCLGALTSLALHALLITPLVVGFVLSTKRPPLNSSEFANSMDDSPSSAMTLILLADSDPAAHDTSNATAPASAVPPLQSVHIPTPPLKYNLPAEDDADTNREAAGEPSQPDPGRQLLFGRYIGQITARIERAWMRPRTPIDSALFKCRVRVTQNRRGVVEAVELVRCNGNLRWQMSLVQAIQSASPLPAPPDTDVFTKELTLDLQSATFAQDDTADGFEPEARTIGLSRAALR
jgi:TonB C terminal